MKKWHLAAGLLAAWSLPAFAHSGGLDAAGCHHDRKNGGYHCHSQASPKPSQTATAPQKPVTPLDILAAAQGPLARTPARPIAATPSSPGAPDALEGVEIIGPARQPGDGFDVVRPSTRQLVQLAQTLLRVHGYEITDEYGELGYDTIQAIRKFEGRSGAPATGKVTPAILLKLAETKPGSCPD